MVIDWEGCIEGCWATESTARMRTVSVKTGTRGIDDLILTVVIRNLGTECFWQKGVGKFMVMMLREGGLLILMMVCGVCVEEIGYDGES